MQKMIAVAACVSAFAVGVAQASFDWPWRATLSPGQSTTVLGIPYQVQCAPKGTYNYYAEHTTSYGLRFQTDAGAPRADYYSGPKGLKNIGTVSVTCYAK